MKRNLTNVFFTNFPTQISRYCLIQIRDYQKNAFRKHHRKEEFMIDPGVHELMHKLEYSQIDKLRYYAQFKDIPISIDYPPDMQPEFQDIFIQKTQANIERFAHNHAYIITPQYKNQDFESFTKNFSYNCCYMNSHIVGIGNLCRIMAPNAFTDNVFKFLNANIIGIRYHFYGLALRLIKKYLKNPNFYWSIDSTKWTRAVTNDFKYQHGVCCRKNNRDLYLTEYINEIRKTGVEIDY